MWRVSGAWCVANHASATYAENCIAGIYKYHIVIYVCYFSMNALKCTPTKHTPTHCMWLLFSIYAHLLERACVRSAWCMNDRNYCCRCWRDALSPHMCVGTADICVHVGTLNAYYKHILARHYSTVHGEQMCVRSPFNCTRTQTTHTRTLAVNLLSAPSASRVAGSERKHVRT